MASQELSEHPTTKKPLWQAAMHLAKKLKPNFTHPYLNDSDWKTFDIACGPPLDLKWGSSIGDDFLRLVELEKMQQIASQCEFDSEDWPEIDSEPEPYEQFSYAGSVAEHFDGYIKSVYLNKPLAEKLKWKFRTLLEGEEHLLRYTPGDAKWMIDQLASVKNSDLPHMSCILREAHKLKEDTLMFSEVWAVIILAILFLQNNSNSEYEVVPVTVLTLSGMTFRIVQGFVDCKEWRVKIRKSSVMAIGYEKEDFQSRAMLWLRWLLAEPILPGKH
ncbi:hypothetical protein F4777DRAFT_579760 [Nemania sp. FL0916]|nr:hypothetical protein F4777DRAFT_579760 [Nemania sp. FL0916]